MEYVIGISAYYHDSSVCVFKNGQLIFACEEEKFSGIKHDASFPKKSLEYAFKHLKINKKDIEAVCYYEDPKLKFNRVLDNIKPQIFKNVLYSLTSLYKVIKNQWSLKKELEKISKNIFYSNHHDSHLYYSYFTSHYNSATCISIDGVGEHETATFAIANGNKLTKQTLGKYPHSLGLFYSTMTAFLGFRPNEGEYKVMGLAAYGNPNVYIDKVRKLINFKNSTIKCDMDYFAWNKSYSTMYTDKLGKLLQINPRIQDDIIDQSHKDLAAAIQLRYEEILFDIIKVISIITQNDKLCLGGGCAYNGLANGKIIENTIFNHLWIPVAPSDAGSAIGACINYLNQNNKLRLKVNKNPFIGPFFENSEIDKAIKGIKHRKFTITDRLNKFIADEISKGKVVGWHHGHMEFGARALGNRSILASPTINGMKDRINKLIKKRETFRPFAPIVIKSKQHEFFEMYGDVPYMNQVVKVKPQYWESLKEVVHVDGTARVQTAHQNTQMFDLLLEVEKKTGFPILLNTSFNIKDKTMVLSPSDAINTFYNTDLDILVLGNYVITK